MKNEITIRVYDFIGSRVVASSKEGNRVHDVTCSIVYAGGRVVLSFEGVRIIGLPFLHEVVGRLYREIRRGDIKLTHLSDLDKDLVKLVIENAEEYYRNNVGE